MADFLEILARETARARALCVQPDRSNSHNIICKLTENSKWVEKQG